MAWTSALALLVVSLSSQPDLFLTPATSDERGDKSFEACLLRGRTVLFIDYRSRQPMNDVARLAVEANQVFQAVRREAERRRIPKVTVWPTHLKPDGSEISTGFAYRRRPDASWQSPGRTTLAPLESVRDGPPFTAKELQDMGAGVASMPDFSRYPGLPSLASCVVANGGTAATSITVEYDDRSFWTGDRRVFDQVVDATTEEAERSSFQEFVIVVHDEGRAEKFRRLRTGDGKWAEALPLNP